MQIDLANTLVLKVYFCLSCIIHHCHCPQAWSPLLWRGRGRLLERLSEGGSYSIAACAAANRAMGTRNGEQLT